MNEHEPSLEQQLESLRFNLENLDPETNPTEVLNEARDVLSAIPDRPDHLLNDFMTQRRDLTALWSRAVTAEEKIQVVDRIKRGLGQMLNALSRRPKT